MPSTISPLAPRSLTASWDAIRTQVRLHRQDRARRQSLARDLASYTSENDLNDLGATLDRYDEADTRVIRRILATQRSS